MLALEQKANSKVRRVKVLEMVAECRRDGCTRQVMASGRKRRGKKWRGCGGVGMRRVRKRLGRR